MASRKLLFGPPGLVGERIKASKLPKMPPKWPFWAEKVRNEAGWGGPRSEVGGLGRRCRPGLHIWEGNGLPPAQGRPTTDLEAKNRSKRAENGPKRHFEAFWGLRRACKPDFRPQMDANSRKWGSGREVQQENRKFA